MTKKHWFDFLRWVIDAEVSGGAGLGAFLPAQVPRRRAAAPMRLALVAALLGSGLSLAQETATRRLVPPPDSLNDSVRALSAQVQQLQETVAEMRRDSQQARAETRALQRQVDELRASGRGAKSGDGGRGVSNRIQRGSGAGRTFAGGRSSGE